MANAQEWADYQAAEQAAAQRLAYTDQSPPPVDRVTGKPTGEYPEAAISFF